MSRDGLERKGMLRCGEEPAGLAGARRKE